MKFINFIKESFKVISKGNKYYYIWISSLLLLILWGALGYLEQLKKGLAVTNMTDSISWGF